MAIPTEAIGSIPRPQTLIDTIVSFQAGRTTREALDVTYAEAIRDTIQRLEETGSPVLSDGEQTKPSFATYPLSGLKNLAPDGVAIPFADGHTRQLPRLTAGPFRYGVSCSGISGCGARRIRRKPRQASSDFGFGVEPCFIRGLNWRDIRASRSWRT